MFQVTSLAKESLGRLVAVRRLRMQSSASDFSSLDGKLLNVAAVVLEELTTEGG